MPSLTEKLATLNSRDLRTAIEAAVVAAPDFAETMSAAVETAIEQQRRRRQLRKTEASSCASDAVSSPASLTPLYSMIFDDSEEAQAALQPPAPQPLAHSQRAPCCR